MDDDNSIEIRWDGELIAPGSGVHRFNVTRNVDLKMISQFARAMENLRKPWSDNIGMTFFEEMSCKWTTPGKFQVTVKITSIRHEAETAQFVGEDVDAVITALADWLADRKWPPNVYGE